MYETRKSKADVSNPLYYREVELQINAPAELIYNLIADLPRMGEWSPECYKSSWLDGATGAAPGVRVRGTNKWRGMRWSRTAEIIVAEPGREFAFQTIPTLLFRDSTVWRYRLESNDGGGTLVTESFALTQAWLPIRLLEEKGGRLEETPKNMRLTLERLKVHAEKLAAKPNSTEIFH